MEEMSQSGRSEVACGHCLEESKCRHREFSPQIWSLLIYWKEVEKSAVNKPMCDECYSDIREMLIDRSAEMEKTLNLGGFKLVNPKSRNSKVKIAS